MHLILSRLATLTAQTRRLWLYVFILALIGGIYLALKHEQGGGIPNMDKVLHASAFFSFAFLLDLATTGSFWRWKLPLLLCYGGFIEILQAFVPWRSCSLADLAADACGILIYWVLWRTLLKRALPHGGD